MTAGTSETRDPGLPDETHLLESLIESADDALWLFTPDWEELLFVNSAYEEIFGGSEAALRENPESFLERTHPADREMVRGKMTELSSGSPTDLEFRVDPDEEFQTWVWVQGQPVYDDSGEVEAVAGYTRDITERKRHQQELERKRTELERANQSLREFAYIASHDLQEPLRMVSSYVDLLDEEYGDQLDDEARAYMEFAVEGARRMKRMIDSLLEYSRVHTEADEFEETDTQTVFEDVRKDLELYIEEHDAEVSVDDLPTVEADRDQLRRVFQNLVKNAIEHTGDGGRPRVEVTSADGDEAFEFAVSDDGPGVPEEERDDIFEIFHRGTSSGADNTGIGLAVAKRIVHRHGGSIWVESGGENGATFRFTIPRSREAVSE
jgi:PAS domain S-box-containing protein